MKPLLAADYEESRLCFPLGAQPKIDGVRGLTTELVLTGRSLKRHKNLYTTRFYSAPEYANLDGELAADDERSPTLCRTTSSALSRIEGEPFTLFHVFDWLHKSVYHLNYADRYEQLCGHIKSQQSRGLCSHARVVPMFICRDLEELLHQDTLWLQQGYEGTIIRGLEAGHKQGRSTVSRGELLRIKRFIDAEALVVSLEEGNDNNNVPQTNELGRTFRTSHRDNKTPNGTIGNMQCVMLEDVMYQKQIILKKHQTVTVSPGTMDHATRKQLFENQDQIVQHVVKFKFFPKGIKDKPRFPTYQAHRSAEDMG